MASSSPSSIKSFSLSQADDNSQKSAPENSEVTTIPAPAPQNEETLALYKDKKCPEWISSQTPSTDSKQENEAKHVSSGFLLPATSTYNTDFPNVSTYREKFKELSEAIRRENGNDNSQYSEKTGEIIPTLYLNQPLHQGDLNSPFIRQIDPNKSFRVIGFVFGERPTPWIDSTGIEDLYTGLVSSCSTVILMAKNKDGEGMRSMAHFYRVNRLTAENIRAKDKDRRRLGYTGALSACVIGAWVDKENYDRDKEDMQQFFPGWKGEEASPEVLAEVGKLAETIVNLLSELGYKVTDWTRENRPPYEYSNRYSNIASCAEIDQNGQPLFSVFPDARLPQHLASES